MLSVVVYGRNDSHGYNLHKRAALSLNAIAHVLDKPGDEILFVDYNTPDELPTFPETIADTLTDEARQRIRIIRVRPAFHARFADTTTLMALESQSRNIAIRRGNPDNRWVLSTNTDMIFAPAQGGSMSAVFERLADGFYHLPRFELPEGFWERADRRDPEAMIRSVQRYGRRYHLNEVVYGGFDNLYEGPGDFQLFLRDDLFRIGGFDERMIHGWHVDANIARRMRLLRGQVDTVFPALSGYHCGHTRQATALHRARRTENCLDTFVRTVNEPRWTDSDDWGAPAEPFEEYRLAEDRGAIFLQALSRAVPFEGPDVIEASYDEKTYREQGFSADHVLPHLADVVFNLCPEQSIFVVASDRALIEGFAAFATAPPLQMKITLCEDGESPGAAFEKDRFDFAALERGLAEADVLLLQYPNAGAVDVGARADLEWFVQQALDRFVALEREKPANERRRVIIVNGMHNPLQHTINDSIDAAAMPFSSRLRHGRVMDAWARVHPLVEPGRSPDATVCASLSRRRSFSETDRATIAAAIAKKPGWQRLALELVSIGDDARWAAAIGLEANAVHEAQAAAKSAIEALGPSFAAAPVALTARPEVSNRLCSSTDWEDPSWFDLAQLYFGEHIYGLNERSRWVWERVSLLHELRRRLPSKTRPWVLLVAPGPDRIATMLSHQGYKVAYASVSHVLGAEEVDWTPAFDTMSLIMPNGMCALASAPVNTKFDAIIAPGAALFSGDEEMLAKLFARIAPLLNPGAHVGATSLVHLNGKDGGGALGHAAFVRAMSKNGVLGRHGVHRDAAVDGRIPLDTVLKFAFEDNWAEGVPGLSFGYDADTVVTIGQCWGRYQLAPIDFAAPSRDRSVRQPIADYLAASNDLPDDVFVETMREMVVVYPGVFSHVRRNLLPFVLSDQIRSRSTAKVSFASTGARVRAVCPVRCSGDALTFDLAIASPGSEGDVNIQLIRADGQVVATATTTTGGARPLTFAGIGRGDVLVLVTIEAQDADIQTLNAWSEMELADA